MDTFFDATKVDEYPEDGGRVVVLKCYATGEYYELVMPLKGDHYTREVRD
tara:strand:+ start:324 stop:473 length:150 start_codon:yes stop_codon:yes gene_type:complete